MKKNKNVEENKKPAGSNVVAKAGIWFTVCNFAFRGMAFFTVPIFTRLLTKVELGSFSNYSSWITILMVLTSLELYESIVRSKVEFEEDIDSYIWSILSFSTLFTLVLYVFAVLNISLVSDWLQVEPKYIHLMFLYFLTSPAYSMLITKHRAFYHYKLFVLITAIVTLSSTALSVTFVLTFEDKLWGRALGQYLPSIIVGGVILIYLAFKGKHIKLQYWKYALVICVPLVPHTLSAQLLSSSDRIILTQLCGSEITAFYSVASSCYHITTILMNSMNKAWTPWLFDQLKRNRYEKIRSFSKAYILIFAVCAWGVMLIGPELIYIFGGTAYAVSVYCLLPLMTSCIIQFIYLFYVNVEFYTKKTVATAMATMTAAALNIVLNFAFIPIFPEYGYVVASYTTLVGYFVLMLIHYFIVRQRGLAHIYDTKFFVLLALTALLIMGVINMLYQHTILRYIITLVYGGILLCFLLKHKDEIVKFFKKGG
ncbi:MAG: oligosaccharide flippase family protein [Clostridiales bacterium]|nr:oligosaccharide flippase family protein [Clostridiales bacterium]